MTIKKQSTVIIIYGPIAVGKLTVAKELAKKIDFKVTHNHLINDLAWSVFTRGEKDTNAVVEKLRYDFYESAIKYGHNIILTHTFSYNYVSGTGLKDPDYMKKLEKKLEKAGAKVLCVHLQAHTEKLFERVKGESRKEHKKLVDVKILKNLSKEKDWITTAPVKNNLIIDNTNLSPKKTAALIIEHYKINNPAASRSLRRGILLEP
jgi:deoxyadenosine/deoxycytidine kinase